jgi:hypothetical protein
MSAIAVRAPLEYLLGLHLVTNRFQGKADSSVTVHRKRLAPPGQVSIGTLNTSTLFVPKIVPVFLITSDIQ